MADETDTSFFRKLINRAQASRTFEAMAWITGFYLFVFIIVYFSPPSDTMVKVVIGLYVLTVVGYFSTRNDNRNFALGTRMSELKKYGFELEQRGQSWGYKGICKGYFMRVYYSCWGGYQSGTKLIIILYYKQDAVDAGAQLERLRKKYSIPTFSIIANTPNRSVFPNEIVVRHNYMYVLDVKKRVDALAEIAVREGLIPMSEKEVDEMITAGDNYDSLDGSF